MIFDAERFLTDYNLPIGRAGEAPNVGEGWVGTHCPFCRDNNFHLGFCITENRPPKCWRCGVHDREATIFALLPPCGVVEAGQIQRKYLTGQKTRTQPRRPRYKGHRAGELKPPSGIQNLTMPHFEYLHKRGFMAGMIEYNWNIKSTGHIGPYAHRIYIPVHHNGQLVSYQCRTIANLPHVPRYKSCKSTDELRPLKHCLYGLDKVEGESCVVVEGPMDVWRLGPGAVGTFGTGVSATQLILLRRFRQVTFIPDNDEHGAGLQSAVDAANVLALSGVETYIEEIDAADPAEMEQGEANELMRRILG